MTASSLALADHVVVDMPTETPTVHSVPRGACDFGGDGRIVDGLASGRSAFACPLFYAAVLASPVLFVAVAVIRLFRLIAEPWGRRS